MIELFCAFSQEPRLRRGKVANARNRRSNAYNAVCRYGAFAPRFFYALGSAVRRYGAFAPRFFYALGSAVCRYGAFAPRFFPCPRFGSPPLWRVLPQSRVRVALLAMRYPESYSARRARVCAGKRSAKPRRVGEHRRFVRRIRRLSTRSRRRCGDCRRSCSRLRGGRVRSFWRWGRVCIRRKLSRCPQALG